MRRKQKTTIVTIESRERTTIRRGPRSLVAWCEQCCADVLMVTPNEAAVITQTDARAIFRGVEAGNFHFIERAGGAVMVCSKSLPIDSWERR
ncbi:MAG TPA: hypothetical protein VK557_06830 [Pyrinomonadaceae bacterium]|nr:hypothetical protein [Pyrinomonadaceae bacterium]